MKGGVLKCVKRMVLKTIRAVKRRVGWNPTPTAYEYRRNFNLGKRTRNRKVNNLYYNKHLWCNW